MQMNSSRSKIGLALYGKPGLHRLFLFLILTYWTSEASLFAAASSPRPFGSIAELLAASAQMPVEQPVVLTNVIVAYAQEFRSVFIQDPSGGLLASSEDPGKIKVGDVVKVSGRLVKDGFSDFLRGCKFEGTGRTMIPKAVPVSAKELLDRRFDMRLVQIEGKLETEIGRAGDILQFNLRSGTVFFRAELTQPETGKQLEDLLPESIVRLTGICSIGAIRGSQPSTFRVLLRSPADVLLVRPPPLWTLDRTLILLAIVSCITLLAFAWIFSLRYQVRRKTEVIQNLNNSLARKVEARTAELVYANKELETFSYSISHDLKAPLRAIRNFSQFLADDYAQTLPDEARRFVKLINDGAQRMDRLIEDLLLFSRLSRTPLRRQTIDMTVLLRECFNDVKAGVPDRSIELCLNSLPGAEGDLALLRQVFINLFSNAVKYTRPRPEARIEVGVAPVDGQTAYYIKDNGVGFDMKYVHKLFGVFQRLHSLEEFEGTGAGLAIVQQIVRRHGGRVWAESTLNEGATFFVMLGKPETTG
ncbi:MAG: hypothetical protein JWM99_4032 [Verrucomicrobiales bacterium]|nr:hypothetical protein [Verrucomicrobiales bacterium]